MDILTKEDWWQVVEDNAEAIRDMLYSFQRDHREVFDPFLKSKDWEKLHSLFNAMWSSLPDDPSIHGIKGFHALCDLCSEDWVFHE